MTRLVVLSGPSGVGKGTVLARTRELVPDLWVSTSVTTRAPRPGEVDGVAYRFATPEEFRRLVDEGGLLEHASYAGHRYGTPRLPVEEVLAEGRPALLEIELEGARQVRAALGERSLLVLLTPPDEAELARRLARRGTEEPAAVARRLARAVDELAAAPEFDAVVVNDSVEAAAARLVELLQQAQSS